MSYDVGALDATLAAAAGNDPALFAELRRAFLDSLTRQVDLLGRARCDANWEIAALRIKGLAASFQVLPLVALAEQALDGAPGDPVVLRRLNALADQIAVA